MKNNFSLIPSSFIESELNRSGLELRKTSNNIMIPCPFHRETHPSLSVAISSDKVPPGVWGCFGCAESGTWNKLARRLGLRQWNPDEDVNPFEFVNTNKIHIENEIKKDCLKLTEWTNEYHWKTYKAKFLKKFGAKLCYDNKYKSNFLYLPISYLSDEYGYCKVRLDPKLQASKYWFSPNMDKVLYPIDYIIDNISTKCIVLVEGMADAFRLLKNGIPALALLGVVITPFMEEQLESLAIKNIILCLDGDEPGQRAMFGYTTDSGKEIIGLGEKLENLGYNVRILPLPKEKEKLDPDSMPKKYVRCLGKMCQSLGGPKYED